MQLPESTIDAIRTALDPVIRLIGQRSADTAAAVLANYGVPVEDLELADIMAIGATVRIGSLAAMGFFEYVPLENGFSRAAEQAAQAYRDLGSSPFDDIVNPPATPEEWEALRQSAREFGILNPLILWGDSGRSKPPVLAGNRHLKVALELDLESVPSISRDFPSREAAKQFAIRENTERREMTILTRTMAADELWRLFDKAADKKSSAAAGMPPRKRAALAAGVSEGTLAAFRFVKETGDEELIADMLAEKLPISAAHRQAKILIEGVLATGKPSTGSVKVDKALDDLKAVMGILKKLPALSEQIVKGLPKAVKKADRERFLKQLTSAGDFIGTVRKDNYLGALESAIKAAEAGVS